MPRHGRLVASGEKWMAEIIPVVPDLVRYQFRAIHSSRWIEGHARTPELGQATVANQLGEHGLLTPNELITWTPADLNNPSA